MERDIKQYLAVKRFNLGNGFPEWLRGLSYVAVIISVIFLMINLEPAKANTVDITDTHQVVAIKFVGPSFSCFDNYKNKKVGDSLEFGRYPQGSNGEIKSITWRVLRRYTDSLLIMSEKGLDAKPFNKKKKSITWLDCTLRSWLNNEFYKKSFNEQERSLIKKTVLTNNAGPSTKDYVFLLSSDEVL
ncbi:hypothetical protein IJT10_03330 [bacterium]|nr:hypothetical protein [bacterium]